MYDFDPGWLTQNLLGRVADFIQLFVRPTQASVERVRVIFFDQADEVVGHQRWASVTAQSYV